MNDMSLQGGSRLIVKPGQHGIGSGLPKEEHSKLIRSKGKECRAGKNHTYHQIGYIPIPHETLQINVKGQVRER